MNRTIKRDELFNSRMRLRNRDWSRCTMNRALYARTALLFCDVQHDGWLRGHELPEWIQKSGYFRKLVELSCDGQRHQTEIIARQVWQFCDEIREHLDREGYGDHEFRNLPALEMLQELVASVRADTEPTTGGPSTLG